MDKTQPGNMFSKSSDELNNCMSVGKSDKRADDEDLDESLCDQLQRLREEDESSSSSDSCDMQC